MADRKSEIRKQLMIMIALTLVVDAIAIAAFTKLGIENAPRDRKLLFTGAWTLVSVIIVLNGLYRIRIARNMGARTRR